MPYEVMEWQDLNITAVSSINIVRIFALNNPITIMHGINREEFSKNFIPERSICYLDWGYGITPTISREKSMCLLAIGWGKVLQIVIFRDPYQGNSGLTYDGYYICDYPIDCVKFISDSVIMILVNKKEVRILFVPSFLPGSFAEEGLNMKEQEDRKVSNFDMSNAKRFQVSLGEDFLRGLS